MILIRTQRPDPSAAPIGVRWPAATLAEPYERFDFQQGPLDFANPRSAQTSPAVQQAADGIHRRDGPIVIPLA
jgi:hypothetical protein